MIRLVAALLLVLSLLGTACSPDAATSRAELGSSAADAAETSPDTDASIATTGDTDSNGDGEPLADDAAATGDSDQLPNVVIAPTPVPDGPRPLIVATLLGESGVLAPLDRPALAGVIAQVDRLNEAGGVLGRPIEVRRFDTNSRVSVTERLVQRFIDNPPDLIITSCDTDVSQPALEFADEFGLLTISPCADDVRYLTGGLGSMNYTLGAPSESQGALAAAAAIERYGSTAIVLRDVTSPEAIAFCDGFERAFRELGGSVVYRDEFSYDTLEPVQDRLAERGGESSFITLCSHVPGGIDAAPSIILILRTLGFQAPIVAGSTLDQPGWFSDVPTLGELLFISWSSTYGNDPDDEVNDLVRSIQQGGSIPPGVSTVLGAEAIEAWARAAEIARDATPERVGNALASFNNESFSTGELSFVAGARMDLGRTYRLLRVIDGELSVVGILETED